MNRHFNRASNLILMLLAVLSLIAIIQETINCHTDPSLTLWISALCVFTWYAASFRRGLLIGMPLSAMTLYLAYRRFGADPTTELTDLFDKITGIYYENIFAPGSVYDYLNATTEQTLVLLFLAFLLTAYLSSSLTSRSGRMVMSFMGTVPFFVACLSVNGTPSVVPVVGMVLFWILLLVSGGSYDSDNNDGRAVFFTIFPVLLLLLIVLWFNRPELYHPEEQDQSLNLRFDDWNRRFNRWIGGQTEPEALSHLEPKPHEDLSTDETALPVNETSPWRSEQGILDLTRDFDPDSLDTLLFRVKADLDGALYLRTVSYGDYTGNAWLPEEIGPYSSLPYTALAIGVQGEEHSIHIRDYSGFAYRTLPYYTQEAGTDSYIPATPGESYRVQYRRYSGDFSSLSVPEASRREEEIYSAAAASYYTRLPESTKNAMLSICERESIPSQLPEAINAVADYVRKTASYDLNPPPYFGDDYALYFLAESHRGYCVHFASAATAMYRALGIPARITEGFLIQCDPGEFQDVKIDNAHAWVEIYQSGTGWIPIEVTGQSGLSDAVSEQLTSPAEAAEEQEVQETSVDPAESSPDPLPVGIITEKEETNPETGGTGSSNNWPIVRIVLAILLTLGVIPLWRPVKRKLLENQLNQSDRKRAAVVIWRCAAKAAAYDVAAVPQIIIKTAEKASFSQHGISEEERNRAVSALQDMLRETYSGLKPWKRIRFKYFQGLI